MSKYSVCIILGLVLLAACGEKTTTKYEAPDFEQEAAKLKAQIELVAPDGSTTAVQLMYAMNVDKAMKAMMQLMQPEMVKAALLIDKDFDHEQSVFFQKVALEEIDLMMPDLIEDFASIYEKRFSEEELNELLAFYQSGAGRKMIEQQPLLMADGAQIGEGLNVELEKRMMRRAAEYKSQKAKINE